MPGQRKFNELVDIRLYDLQIASLLIWLATPSPSCRLSEQEAGGRVMGGILLRTGRSFTFMHGDLLRRPKHGYEKHLNEKLFPQMKKQLSTKK